MKKFFKRLTALALAASMALGLAACGGGKDGDGDAQKLSGIVYVPQFVDCGMKLDYVNSGCITGEDLYLVGTVGEEQEVTETDENGEEYTYMNYSESTLLCKVSLTDGTSEELTAYTAPESNKEDGGGYVQGIKSGGDGTIWLHETEWGYVFDLPENFDPETDDKWNYMSDYEEKSVLRHLDGEGNELGCIEITSELMEQLGIGYFNNYLFDQDGNLCVLYDKTFVCLDGEMNEVYRLEGEADPEDGSSYSFWENAVLLSDGRLGVLTYGAQQTEERMTSGYTLRPIDPATHEWAEGEEYPLSNNVYNIFPGGGDYLFYYQNGDTIYGCQAGAAEGERIFSWIDSDINQNNVEFFSFLSDGRVCAVTRDWDSDKPKVELALLTATDASELPEKTTLTFATLWLDYNMRKDVIDFNKSSDKYRIEVKDYSEFNTQDDYQAGLQKLNTEIMAGTVPDILDTDELPYQRFGQRGYLEDLWPFIESDPDLGREGVMEHVLDAASQDGKLYHVFNSFSIKTVAGTRKAVGDRISWTLADMQAALAAMPEGCTLFNKGYVKRDMLDMVLTMNLNGFVDWTTGECSFDDGNFKSLLEFCNGFPDEYVWTEEDDVYYDEGLLMLEGRQLLQPTYLYGLSALTRQRTLFENAGGVSYVGYPKEDGACGSSFRISGTCLAISSTCADKEGAWSFVREILMPESEYYGGFSVNKKSFDEAVEQAMTPNEAFETDDNGDPVLGPDGQALHAPKDWYWLSEDQEIKVYESTQADYDQLMELYNATAAFDNRDDNIYEIVADDAASYFAGDKDLDTVVSQIQSRVYLYVNEQM